ncbi:MAG: PAS domain S-box protein [Desulfobacterales bacterium]|nr:PAS domain S-box protein [Desulfobacterales bacterium]
MEIDESAIHDIDEEKLYETILNTVGDGVTVVDKNYRIIFQNRAIRKFYDDKIGKNCFRAYFGRDKPCVGCTLRDILKDGKIRRGIRDCQLPDGRIIYVEHVDAPLRDVEGNIIGKVEAIRDVTRQLRLTEECGTLRRELRRKSTFENIVTQSGKMKAIFHLIERVAATTSSVLITGDSGTGKELIARAIHVNSNRKDAPIVPVNCGAIPENLLESELFGHVKGAFTGAVNDHMGLIETADGGSLFLDEVGEIPLSLQVKLLRFLQEGECRRVGDAKIRNYDVRIISATNRGLERAVREGAFREDFFFRLNVIPINLPPLRERREDIPLLATHLLQRLCDDHGRSVSGVSSRALKILMDYSWPGNVREMENVIEYAIHLSDDGRPIDAEQLPPRISGASDPLDGQRDFVSIEAYTRRTIQALQVDQTEEQIAQTLGISRKNLWEKRKRWNLQRPEKT